VKTKKEIKNVISAEIGSIFREKVAIAHNLQSLCFSSMKRNFVTTVILHFFYSIIDTGCPRVAKKLHNLFVIKDINFYFFLDDSYVSTAIRKILRYIQGVSAKTLEPNISVICQRIFMKFKMQIF
jgi:hypothetical protein